MTGVSAVQALFARRPQEVERLFFDARTAPLMGEACSTLALARRPYRLVSPDELAKIAGTVLHGGVVAVTRPPEIPDLDPEEAKRWAADGKPLILLDGVGNPHNLGAIARTAAFFGLDRIVISDHPGQAGPSEAAWRVSEGGLEHVRLYRAPRFAGTLKRLRESYRVIGTALEGGQPFTVPRDRKARPVAIVLGNEESGLPPATLAACEEIAYLPGSGRVQSLNVAATAAILIHALAS